jgi:hypothetical protein
MQQLTAVAAVLALMAVPAAGADQEALLRRPSLSLQLGRPLAAESYWDSGGFAGALTYDLPVTRSLSFVLTAAASAGSTYSGPHGNNSELAEQHIAAGIRLISDQHGLFRTFGWAGLAYFRAERRLEVWQDTSRHTTRYSTRTPGAVVGVGLLANIWENRSYLVAEFTGLLPFNQAQADETTYPPQQLFATLGLRLVL